MIRLHLGCGTRKLDGWVNIDAVAACSPDLVHDLQQQPLPYPDLTVAEILAEDLLEHFDKYMRYLVFSDWIRVLALGGTVTLQVPDFKKILFRYFRFGFDNFLDFVFGENLWNSNLYTGHFGNHKWGYSKQSLIRFARQFGIEPIEVRTQGLNIRFVGRKVRHVPLEQLDQIMIHSHANKCGPGPADVELGFARSRIQAYQRNQAARPEPATRNKENAR